MLFPPGSSCDFQGAAIGMVLARVKAVNIIKPRGALSPMAAILCWTPPVPAMAGALLSGVVKAPSQPMKVVWLGFANQADPARQGCSLGLDGSASRAGLIELLRFCRVGLLQTRGNGLYRYVWTWEKVKNYDKG